MPASGLVGNRKDCEGDGREGWSLQTISVLKEQFHNWYSHTLGRDFQVLEFGHAGRPIILFPSSMGRYFEAKDRGLIEAVRWFVEKGDVRIYCVDSIDELSWYNTHIHPSQRAYNHSLYDQFIRQDVLERTRQDTGHDRVIVAGCSFGGYHAANFAFRYPERVSALLSMSGAFDIRSQVDGYYDDTVYFNNPVDFLPGSANGALYDLRIILGTGEHDICRGHNEQLSGILHQKDIGHWLDVREGGVHDWPLWLQMFPHYLSVV